MDWATKRKVKIVGVLGAVALLLLGWFVYAKFIRVEPTCFDGKQNQSERGIDCSGECIRICSGDVSALVPAWARYLPVTETTGNVLAVIENTNRAAVAGKVPYEIRLYDERNILVTDPIRGTVTVEPNGRTAVLTSNISVGERKVTRVFVSFPEAFNWVSVDPNLPRNALSTDSVSIEMDPFIRLSARLQNRGSVILNNVQVVAILYDTDGNAVAASETSVDTVPSFGSTQLSFTWPPTVRPTVGRIDFIPHVPGSFYAQVPTQR